MFVDVLEHSEKGTASAEQGMRMGKIYFLFLVPK